MKRTSLRIFSITVLLLLALSGCAAQRKEPAVAYLDEKAGADAYAACLEAFLPDYTVAESDTSVLIELQHGNAARAFDVQAVPACDNGLAAFWYPQHLATAVIAVDRGRTDAQITGWHDLAGITDEVGFLDSADVGRLLLASIAYGLEGAEYTTDSAFKLLREIAADNRLVRGDAESPVLICMDYQAAALAGNGADIEIIVPCEGTFSFEVGIVSQVPIDFPAETDDIFLTQGLRALSGETNGTVYPGEADYARAVRVDNFGRFAEQTERYARDMRHTVLRTRLFSSADQVQHQLFAAVFVALVAVWAAIAVYRIQDDKTKRLFIEVAALIIGWVLLRHIKYQIDTTGFASRMCWYGYYVFQLAIPLVMLFLAWSLDGAGRDSARKNFFKKALVSVQGVLLALVLTNDLHFLVFRMDLSRQGWSSDYSYGPVYYVVLAACMLPILLAIFIMVKKALGCPKRTAILFSLLFCVLLAAYGVAFVLGVPLARDSDFVMTVGAFAVLFFELALRSGLIPINTKYRKLFSASPLKMQLVDMNGKTVLASASCNPIGKELWRQVCASPGKPVEEDGDTLVYSDPIPGGAVVWQEDISGINALHREILENIERIKAANALLAKEKESKTAAAFVKQKLLLTTELEKQIKKHTDKLSDLVNGLGCCNNKSVEITRITMLLCYIKRRCNLFFREMETAEFPVEELEVYLDELAEFSGYAGIKVATAFSVTDSLTVRCGTLLYDFLYAFLDACVVSGGETHVLQQLVSEGEGVVMRLLPSAFPKTDFPDESLREAIKSHNGVIRIKKTDDSFGISLYFQNGGKVDA